MMNNGVFNELFTSLEQADQIIKGQAEPSRAFLVESGKTQKLNSKL